MHGLGGKVLTGCMDEFIGLSEVSFRLFKGGKLLTIICLRGSRNLIQLFQGINPMLRKEISGLGHLLQVANLHGSGISGDLLCLDASVEIRDETNGFSVGNENFLPLRNLSIV